MKPRSSVNNDAAPYDAKGASLTGYHLCACCSRPVPGMKRYRYGEQYPYVCDACASKRNLVLKGTYVPPKGKWGV